MFYSHIVLTKKGLLGKVWVAATLGESRVPKSFASTAKIQVLCKNIEEPAAPFALRLSSALLLGVVRVFNRKSAIILADVNSVMRAIRRFNASQSARRTGEKRQREQLTPVSEANRISLQDGEDMARFDAITLPVRKKQKTSASHGKDGDSRGNKSPTISSGDFLSQGSIMLAEMSLGDSAQLDVLTAMETIFPSIVVPRLGEHLSSRLNSPNPNRTSGSERRLAYRAREQDIALSSPTANLGTDIFQSDLRVSLHSNPVSDAEVSQPMWDSNLGGTVNQGGVPTSGSSDPSQNQPIAQEDGNPTTTHPESHMFFEPLQIEPLDLHAIDEPLAQRPRENSAEGSALRQSVSAGVPSTDEETGYSRPPQGTVGMKRAQSAPQSNSTKRRRLSMDQFDDVTEFTPAQVREFIRDTSDIVLAPHEERVSTRKSRSRENARRDNLTLPSFLRTFSQEIIDLWHAVVEPPFGVPRPQASSTANPAVQAPSGCPKTKTRPADHERQPQYNIPMIEEVEEASAVPEMIDNQRRVSGLDIDRAQEGSKSASNDHFSIPSHGTDGKSNRVSGQGGSGAVSSSGSGRGLADLIDKITASDRREYEIALRSTEKQKSSADVGSAVQHGKDAVSPGIKDAEDSANKKSGEALQTSEFELVEETEKPGMAETAGETPVSAINVRSFKMLELLRKLEDENAQGSNAEVDEKEKITFDNLVQGCSRGTTARAFHSLLNLASAGFVTVNQSEAYGEISVTPSKHF